MNKTFKAVVKIPIYPGNLRIIFTEDLEVVKEFFPDYDRNAIAGVTGVTEDELWTVTTIINPYYNYDDLGLSIYGTIAHEALHVVQEVFYNVGIEMDLTNPEPANYMLGWVVDNIYQLGIDVKLKVK